MNTLRKTFAFALVAAFAFVGFSFSPVNAAAADGLVKSTNTDAVYVKKGTNLYVFDHSKTYFTWYQDFSGIQVITPTELQSYTLAGNVDVRPGTTLVKTPAQANVYVVAPMGVLHAISSEQEAITMFGLNWASKVIDIAPGFFTNYTIGSPKANGVYAAGQLVKASNSPVISYFTGTEFRAIASEAAFNANRFNFDYVVTVPSTFVISPTGSSITGAESALMDATQGAAAGSGNTGGTFDPNGGTQGSIDDINMGSREETEALEGQDDVEIYAVDFELANDGPLQLQRVDVWFEETEANAGGESTRPWDYFTEVSLLVNGTIVETMDADSSSDWNEGDGTTHITLGGAADEYRMRFSGLTGVLSNDDSTKVSVAVTMQNNLDSLDELATWNVELLNFRVLDESGFVADEDVVDFTGGNGLEDSFSVDAEETAQLDVRDAADEMDAMIIEVDEDVDTNGVSIYNFEIEEQNGVDVNIEEMGMTFATVDNVNGGAEEGDMENNVIKRAYLYHGNNKVGEETVPDGGVVVFDNMDIDISGDSEEVFTVKVDLFDNNEGARYGEGTTLTATVGAAATFEATDETGDDVEAADISVSAASNTHHLRSFGISAEVMSATAVVTPGEAAGDDLVTFTWVVDITAFGGETVYVNRDIADVVTTEDAADVDTVYSLEDTGDGITVGGTTVSSSADTATGSVDDFNAESFYEINDNDTETITITVSGENADAGDQQIRGLLQNIEWATIINAGSADNAYTFDLGEDASTPYVTIN